MLEDHIFYFFSNSFMQVNKDKENNRNNVQDLEVCMTLCYIHNIHPSYHSAKNLFYLLNKGSIGITIKEKISSDSYPTIRICWLIRHWSIKPIKIQFVCVAMHFSLLTVTSLSVCNGSRFIVV